MSAMSRRPTDERIERCISDAPAYLVIEPLCAGGHRCVQAVAFPHRVQHRALTLRIDRCVDDADGRIELDAARRISQHQANDARRAEAIVDAARRVDAVEVERIFRTRRREIRRVVLASVGG